MDNFSKPKVIFFDLGDTLIYFNGDWAEVLQKSTKKLMNTLIKEGYSLDLEEFPVGFSKRMREYYLERNKTFVEYTTAQILFDYLTDLGFPKPNNQVIKNAMQDMYSVSQKCWFLEEDTLNILEWLIKNDYEIGLISNASDADDVFCLMERFNLKEYFKHIVISAELGWRKPHNKIFTYAMQLFNANPTSCLMVGDRLDMDIHGAKMAGIQSVWITRRSIHKDKLQQFETKPDHQISNLQDLVKILQ